MAYHMLSYFALFLPIVILLYQVTPQKFRYIILLVANAFFFCSLSRWLIVYLIAAILMTYGVGRWLESVNNSVDDAKLANKKKRRIITLAVWINIGLILVLKYTNFFATNLSNMINHFGGNWDFSPIKFMVPIGLSFYTLQIISYLTDVYRGTEKAEKNLARMALYLSFFPQIMEGPIARYSQTANDLYEGRKITFTNLKYGYQRIVWGLFKKIVIADRLYSAVTYIFDNYHELDGSIILLGAIVYTGQLYMEFSGCMDIIMGSGEIFGIKLPENFRQPFAAKDASDFWHRWHITLGTFFKDYIFYPVSLAKPVKNFAKKVKNVFGKNVSKFVAPTIALFCVWTCNGLWHGANWTFIFYGMYYFVLIVIENITEAPVKKLAEKLHINREGKGYKVFRAVKLFFIVIIGELFFRAATLTDGFKMFGKIFSDFHITELVNNIFNLKLDVYEFAIAVIGLVIVLVVSILKEKNIKIRESISKFKLPARWAVWYAAILIVIFFGAYGSGYTIVDLIYAGY